MRAGMAPGGQRETLLCQLSALLEEITGSSAEVSTFDAPLFLESLDALHFKSAVDARYGVGVPVELLYDGTLAAVADAVLDRLPAADPTDPLPAVTHDANARFDPFPLTEVQEAYWLGAGDLELGGRSAHAYLEVDLFSVSAAEVADAFDKLVAR